MKLFLILSLSLLATACLKTAEQIRREQRVESMSQQLSESQNIVADLTVMLKSLQTQIDSINGRLDVLQKSSDDKSAANSKAIADLTTQVQTLSDAVVKTEDEVKAQRGFVEKVTNKLGSMAAPSSGGNNSDAKSVIAQAKSLMKKKKYSEARAKLEGLVNDSSVSSADMNKVLFHLGEVEFSQKQWEKSLVYFSKIYTKYPKSSLAPTSLLYIGKALKSLGKSDESKQAFDELKSNYPGSSAAKEVK